MANTHLLSSEPAPMPIAPSVSSCRRSRRNAIGSVALFVGEFKETVLTCVSAMFVSVLHMKTLLGAAILKKASTRCRDRDAGNDHTSRSVLYRWREEGLPTCFYMSIRSPSIS